MTPRRSSRDEFACPCCADQTDGSYCLACEVFECGEQDLGAADKCLVPKRVEVFRAVHASHHEGGGASDLLTVDVRIPVGEETPFNAKGEPDVRPVGLPSDFGYNCGTHGERWQTWRFVKVVPATPGKCPRCAYFLKLSARGGA